MSDAAQSTTSLYVATHSLNGQHHGVEGQLLINMHALEADMQRFVGLATTLTTPGYHTQLQLPSGAASSAVVADKRLLSEAEQAACRRRCSTHEQQEQLNINSCAGFFCASAVQCWISKALAHTHTRVQPDTVHALEIQTLHPTNLLLNNPASDCLYMLMAGRNNYNHDHAL
jgi:hypothetical protein